MQKRPPWRTQRCDLQDQAWQGLPACRPLIRLSHQTAQNLRQVAHRTRLRLTPEYMCRCHPSHILSVALHPNPPPPPPLIFFFLPAWRLLARFCPFIPPRHSARGTHTYMDIQTQITQHADTHTHTRRINAHEPRKHGRPANTSEIRVRMSKQGADATSRNPGRDLPSGRSSTRRASGWRSGTPMGR